MNACALRPAVEPDDHRALAALARDIWHEHYPAIISLDQIEYMLANGYSAQTLAAEQAAGTRFVLARISDAGDAGFASVSPDSKDTATAWLDKFYVRRAHRGAGVGRRLLDWAIDTALAIDARALCLRVNRHNAQSVAIYRHAGFAIERADVKPIGQGFVMDDYIMRKPLASAG
jgi:GNAT superfamily N-acetyltransferase